MRILFHHRIASRDGQWVHMAELISALRAEGHEVLLVGPQAFAELRFGGQAGVVAALKRRLPRALYEVLELGYNVPAGWRLWRAMRRFRPDVVYERYNLHLLAGVRCARRSGVPLLLEVNGPLYEERSAHGGLALARLAAASQRATWRGADVVLPVTEALADYVRRAGVPEARIAVIPNGIDPARFAAVPPAGEAKRRLGLAGRLVLGFTGFVRDWHGLDAVIDLLAEDGEAMNLHLLMVGDGPARAGLEARAARLGVARRLTFTGVVDRDRVAGLVAAFDIALQPGVTPYASPLKLFEYLALGRAVVAPDLPNIREVLSDGDNAVLFAAGEPGAMAAAVRRLCADAGLRDSLGARAQATIAERGLTWRENARRVAALAGKCRPTEHQPSSSSEPLPPFPLPPRAGGEGA